jgi:hypothetical protein
VVRAVALVALALVASSGCALLPIEPTAPMTTMRTSHPGVRFAFDTTDVLTSGALPKAGADDHARLRSYVVSQLNVAAALDEQAPVDLPTRVRLQHEKGKGGEILDVELRTELPNGRRVRTEHEVLWTPPPRSGDGKSGERAPGGCGNPGGCGSLGGCGSCGSGLGALGPLAIFALAAVVVVAVVVVVVAVVVAAVWAIGEASYAAKRNASRMTSLSDGLQSALRAHARGVRRALRKAPRADPPPQAGPNPPPPPPTKQEAPRRSRVIDPADQRF